MYDAPVDDAVELLQALGLKEYEAKCFVALSRIDAATARDVSDLSEVPRTRVYDAVGAPVDGASSLDRFLLADGVSVLFGAASDDPHAVVGTGGENALVAVGRRLLDDAAADVPLAPSR